MEFNNVLPSEEFRFTIMPSSEEVFMIYFFAESEFMTVLCRRGKPMMQRLSVDRNVE